MAKRRCDPYIGLRASEEAVKRFGGVRAAARGLGLSKNTAAAWCSGGAPNAFCMAAMWRAGMDVGYILTGKRTGGDGNGEG